MGGNIRYSKFKMWEIRWIQGVEPNRNFEFVILNGFFHGCRGNDPLAPDDPKFKFRRFGGVLRAGWRARFRPSARSSEGVSLGNRRPTGGSSRPAEKLDELGNPGFP